MKINNKTVLSFAVIDTLTNEWLYEAPSYRACVENISKVVPKGRDYVIVGVLKEAKA